MLKEGTIVKIKSDNHSRLFKGDHVRIIKYIPSEDRYYSQRADGQICCMVSENEVEEINNE